MARARECKPLGEGFSARAPAAPDGLRRVPIIPASSITDQRRHDMAKSGVAIIGGGIMGGDIATGFAAAGWLEAPADVMKQRAAARAREHGVRGLEQTGRAHGFFESGQPVLDDRERGLGSCVARTSTMPIERIAWSKRGR